MKSATAGSVTSGAWSRTFAAFFSSGVCGAVSAMVSSAQSHAPPASPPMMTSSPMITHMKTRAMVTPMRRRGGP